MNSCSEISEYEIKKIDKLNKENPPGTLLRVALPECLHKWDFPYSYKKNPKIDSNLVDWSINKKARLIPNEVLMLLDIFPIESVFEGSNFKINEDPLAVSFVAFFLYDKEVYFRPATTLWFFHTFNKI